MRTTTRFVADDGVDFDNMEDCRHRDKLLCAYSELKRAQQKVKMLETSHDCQLFDGEYESNMELVDNEIHKIADGITYHDDFLDRDITISTDYHLCRCRVCGECYYIEIPDKNGNYIGNQPKVIKAMWRS